MRVRQDSPEFDGLGERQCIRQSQLQTFLALEGHTARPERPAKRARRRDQQDSPERELEGGGRDQSNQQPTHDRAQD